MKKNHTTNYRRPFIWAVSFHLLLLALFLFRLNFDDKSRTSSVSTEVVQATLVSSAMLPSTSRPVPPTPPVIEKKVVVPPVQKPMPLEDLSSLPVKKETVQERQPLHHSEIQKVPIETIKAKEAEKTLLFEKEQQKKALKKAALEKQQIEKERQQRLQAEIQQQMEKEQQQKKAQIAVKKQQHEIEQLLQQDLVESQPAKSAGRTAKVAGVSGVNNKEIDRYKSLIISAISHRWIVPENLKAGLQCCLKIRVAPGGMVMGVKLIKSSGDTVLDHSAESAVYKASPLPVPKDVALFNNFREFNLVVRPEGILAE